MPTARSPSGRINDGAAGTINDADEAIELANRFGYPCIIKPVMSSSGKGLSKVDGPADVKKACDYAASGSRVNQGG